MKYSDMTNDELIAACKTLHNKREVLWACWSEASDEYNRARDEADRRIADRSFFPSTPQPLEEPCQS